MPQPKVVAIVLGIGGRPLSGLQRHRIVLQPAKHPRLLAKKLGGERHLVAFELTQQRVGRRKLALAIEQSQRPPGNVRAVLALPDGLLVFCQGRVILMQLFVDQAFEPYRANQLGRACRLSAR